MNIYRGSGGGKGRSGDKSTNAIGMRQDGLASSKHIRELRSEPMSGGRHGYEIAAQARRQAGQLQAARDSRATVLRSARAQATAQAKLGTRTAPKAVKGGLTQVARNLTAKHMRNLRASA